MKELNAKTLLVEAVELMTRDHDVDVVGMSEPFKSKFLNQWLDEEDDFLDRARQFLGVREGNFK